MVNRRIKLVFAARLRSLSLIRSELIKLVSGAPYEPRLNDVLLVVSEACTNVIRHAYDENHARPLIIIECVLGDDYLTIMVCDKGKGLGFLESRPVFSENGGFGLFLIQKLSDKFNHHSSPGSGTILEIGFKNPEHRPSRLKRRKSYATVTEPASVLFMAISDVISHPKKSIVACREYLESGGSSALNNLRLCWNAMVNILLIKSGAGGLRRALDEGDYELARSLIEEIAGWLKVIEREFCLLTEEGRILLGNHLKGTHKDISRLAQTLQNGGNKKMPEETGIYALVRRSEIAILLEDVSSMLLDIIDNTSKRWISLDEGPLQLI